MQKFFYLEPSKRRLLIVTFLLLNSIRVGFLFARFSFLQKVLNQFSTFHSDKSDHPSIEVDQIIWAINVSTQLSPGQAKCLARALTVHTLMKQQGYDPILQIGVIKNAEEEFQAHAWLEYQGKIVVGELPNMEKYSKLHPV
jgi:Transglutaminase-like superfamily